MGLDIRMPIGLMFAIVGLLLTVASLLLDPAVYKSSLGININLWWGIVMLIFGLVMIFFGRRDGASVKLTAQSPEGLRIEAEEHRTGAEVDKTNDAD